MTVLPRHVTIYILPVVLVIITSLMSANFRVVILHQAAITLAIGGVLKPVKLGEVAGMLNTFVEYFFLIIMIDLLLRRIQGQLC